MVLTPLTRDQRAYVVKVPEQGPLSLILGRGSMVTLAVPAAAAPPAPAPSASAPEIRTTALPESNRKVEHVPVVGFSCSSGAGPRPECYAVLAVPAAAIEYLMHAADVWMWIERQ
jgi:hypothetical protein